MYSWIEFAKITSLFISKVDPRSLFDWTWPWSNFNRAWPILNYVHFTLNRAAKEILVPCSVFASGIDVCTNMVIYTYTYELALLIFMYQIWKLRFLVADLMRFWKIQLRITNIYTSKCGNILLLFYKLQEGDCSRNNELFRRQKGSKDENLNIY